jgi:hypothetical protein
MDRLFRQSGLARDKWDEVHYADGSTYGATTIDRAIARTDDVYTPPESASTAAADAADSAPGDERSPPSPATAETPPEPSTADADTPAATPSPSSPDGDSQAADPETTPAVTTQAATTQEPTDQLARIDELTARVEALIQENEALRGDLAAERARRQALERELERERTSWWPL